MKIAIVAPSDEKVPPAKYGGTELVVANLADGLVDQGHEVHLFASGDSTTKAILHSTFPEAFRMKVSSTPYPDELRWFYNTVALGNAATMIRELGVDIVHGNLGWRLLPFADLMQAPLVSTLHGPYDIPFIPEFVQQFPEAKFVSISNTQARLNQGLPFAGTVYNGIRVDTFDFNDKPGDYLVFLGRISPEKGIKNAILSAKAAGVKLIIAAKVDAVDQAYYKAEIQPLIDGTDVEFTGEVDHAGKAALLKNALALLMLIQWEEPFGLVMAESLAAGTPVIAIPRGSVPEIVDDGVTGFHVENTIESTVAAIHKAHTLDRHACRKAAQERFSAEAMVHGYLEVYKRILAAAEQSA